MTREELIEAGVEAMGANDGWRWWHPRHLERLLDVWEPLIRADEREQTWRDGDARLWAATAREADERERIADLLAEQERLSAATYAREPSAYNEGVRDAYDRAEQIARGAQ